MAHSRSKLMKRMEDDVDVFGRVHVVALEIDVQQLRRLPHGIEIKATARVFRSPQCTNASEFRDSFLQNLNHFCICFRRNL